RDARAQRVAYVLTAEVEPGGEAIDLEGDILDSRELEDPLQVEGILGAAVDEATGWVAEAAHGGGVQGLLDAFGHPRTGPPLPAVHTGLDPVELSENVVRQVEPPVGEDVAPDPSQHPERSQLRVRRRDLLALPADVVGGQAPHRADRRSVVADRQVLVASRA